MRRLLNVQLRIALTVSNFGSNSAGALSKWTAPGHIIALTGSNFGSKPAGALTKWIAPGHIIALTWSNLGSNPAGALTTWTAQATSLDGFPVDTDAVNR